jgi:hypothetical protein
MIEGWTVMSVSCLESDDGHEVAVIFFRSLYETVIARLPVEEASQIVQVVRRRLELN